MNKILLPSNFTLIFYSILYMPFFVYSCDNQKKEKKYYFTDIRSIPYHCHRGTASVIELADMNIQEITYKVHYIEENSKAKIENIVKFFSHNLINIDNYIDNSYLVIDNFSFLINKQKTKYIINDFLIFKNLSLYPKDRFSTSTNRSLFITSHGKFCTSLLLIGLEKDLLLYQVRCAKHYINEQQEVIIKSNSLIKTSIHDSLLYFFLEKQDNRTIHEFCMSADTRIKRHIIPFLSLYIALRDNVCLPKEIVGDIMFLLNELRFT